MIFSKPNKRQLAHELLDKWIDGRTRNTLGVRDDGKDGVIDLGELYPAMIAARQEAKKKRSKL